MTETVGLHQRGLLGRLFHFSGAQRLAVRAVAANLGPCQKNVEAKMALDLTPQPLQWLAEKFLYLPALETNYVRMLLLHARFVIVLIAAIVHEIEFIHQAPLFQ